MRSACAIGLILLTVALSSVSSPAFAQEAEPSNTRGSQAAVPPRQQPPRNPDLLRAGMVLTGLGIFAAVAGVLTLQRSGEDASGNAARLGGGILAGGGVVFTIGISFWIVGAAPNGPLRRARAVTIASRRGATMATAALLIACSIPLVGCGARSSLLDEGGISRAGPSSSAGGGGAGGGQGSCGPPGTMCNAPGQCGKVVVHEQAATEPAPSTGGVIVDGTYVVTYFTVYTGPGGATGPLMGNLQGQGTYVFTNGAVQETVMIESEQQPAMTAYLAGTFSTAATKITFTKTCPEAEPETLGDYSASTTQIRIVFLGNGPPEELVLDRFQ